MKGKQLLGIGLVIVLMLTLVVGLALAQEPSGSPLFPAFTYQGRLNSDDVAYTGTCDFQFSLWDALTGGIQIGLTQTVTNVGLVDGYFTVQLDFGPAFQGEARWLGIYVRCPAGSGTYTQLTPRQALTATPYAMYALNSWQLGGNVGTTPGVNFIGTSDNVALELRVNGERVLRLEPNATSPNLVGGRPGNWLISGVYGATIGGGGAAANLNRVTDSYGTIGGGAGNQAGDDSGTTDDAEYATLSGGYTNTASGHHATVGGGQYNIASDHNTTVGGGYSNTASGSSATVSGGSNNNASEMNATVNGGYGNIASDIASTIGGGSSNTASGTAATIGGGSFNTASYENATVGGGYSNTASGTNATIAGGDSNTASYENATVSGGDSNIASWTNATVGGGETNEASGTNATISGGFNGTATGASATIGGGYGNIASGNATTVGGGADNIAEGAYATVPGGSFNDAWGDYSFAAGRRAHANSHGCFVWGDNTDADFSCLNTNMWMARASGGVYFYTNSGLTSGMYLAAGGSAWNAVSNPALKEHFSAIDTQALVESLANMPITTWNYTSQDENIRHIGPMADDFNALLPGLGGEGEMYINSLDADGIALASIQGLYQIIQDKTDHITELEARITALEATRGTNTSAVSRPHFNLNTWLPGLFGLLGVAAGVLISRKRGGSI